MSATVVITATAGYGRSPVALRLALPALLSVRQALALGQPALPPAAVDQFNHTIGRRVEALTILGGDHGVVGGIYSFRGGNLADLAVTKIGGGGDVAAAEPLGQSGLKWAPVVEGNVGHINAENEFASGYLQGNRTEYDVLAGQLGGGARFYFNEHLSLAPTISAIYGHTENEFKSRNAVGDAVKVVASGTYVDWDLGTWSVVPTLDGKYEWLWGRAQLEFSSRYSFFHTESFSASSPVIDLSGDSHTWENKLDADVPLGLTLFGRELRTGGFFARTELFGNIADGVNEDHVYTANGRLVLDFVGKVWKVRWLGLGYSYLWGAHFSGWSAGLDLQFEF